MQTLGSRLLSTSRQQWSSGRLQLHNCRRLLLVRLQCFLRRSQQRHLRLRRIRRSPSHSQIRHRYSLAQHERSQPTPLPTRSTQKPCDGHSSSPSSGHVPFPRPLSMFRSTHSTLSCSTYSLWIPNVKIAPCPNADVCFGTTRVMSAASSATMKLPRSAHRRIRPRCRIRRCANTRAMLDLLHQITCRGFNRCKCIASSDRTNLIFSRWKCGTSHTRRRPDGGMAGHAATQWRADDVVFFYSWSSDERTRRVRPFKRRARAYRSDPGRCGTARRYCRTLMTLMQRPSYKWPLHGRRRCRSRRAFRPRRNRYG